MRAISVIAIMALASTLSACDQPVVTSKYSAEEDAYLARFRAVLDASCAVEAGQTTVVVMENTMGMCNVMGPNGHPQMQPCPQVVPKYHTVPVANLQDAGVTPSLLQSFQKTLPPADLQEAHDQILKVAAVQSLGARPAGELRATAKRACALSKSFHDRVSARPVSVGTTASLYLTFQPPVGPAIGYDTTSGFSIEQSFSVPTPYGDVTAGYKSPGGIHILVVRYDGRERRFTLDRPFEFYLPEGYATKVSFEGKDELIITVER